MPARLSLQLLCVVFAIRDFFSPPREKLLEAGLSPGMRVLDYGCGPGSFSIAASEMTGPDGAVWALDVNPLAVERSLRLAKGKGLANVHGVSSGRETGLDSSTIDMVLLYDVFHDIGEGERGGVLREIHRVLKPEGVLSFSDHHMDHDAIVRGVTEQGLFRLGERKKRTYAFLPVS
ncbi:MAG: class I SAM-dependent methyltransferase [Syntrophobacteraceae bacterium]